MKHWVEVMFYYYYLWAKIEQKRVYEWLRAKQSFFFRIKTNILKLTRSDPTRPSPTRPDAVRPDLAWPWRYLKDCILESIIDTGVKSWHNLDSSPTIVVEIFCTKSNFLSNFDFMSDEDKRNIRLLPVNELLNSSTFYLFC